MGLSAYSLKYGLFFCVLTIVGILNANGQSYYDLSEKGVSCFEKDSLEQAENYFRQALKLDPTNAHNALLFSNLGMVQQKMNKHAEAVESYSYALNFAPIAVPILLNRASAYMNIGQNDNAYLDYCQVLDVDKYNRPEVKVRFIEDSYEFYLNWTFKLERIHNIKKIEMPIGEKIALVQLSKYNSALAHIKSRWFNDDRKILETLWKKYDKSKHRANKVLEDFIKSKEERGLNHDCQYNAYYCHIWIAEFTKQKTITQKSILGLK
jgi:tetratricopeptide (TPR) repeat protein